MATSDRYADDSNTVELSIEIKEEKIEVAYVYNEGCLYGDEKNDNSNEAFSDPVSSSIPEFFAVLSSHAENTAESASFNSQDVENTSHVSQEYNDNTRRTFPLPVYVKCEYAEDNHPSADNISKYTEIKFNRDAYELDSTTYDCLQGDESIKKETISQSVNDVQARSQEPPKDESSARRGEEKSYGSFCETESLHSEEKPYKCEICEYSSIKVSYLKRHMRSHTGEKPYKCSMCEYKCSEGGNLKRHMIAHSGERPYKCKLCEYEGIKGSDLKIHIRTHTKEKPYQCEICGYKCAQGGYLKRHMRTHTGEKPYKCEICEYECAESSKLRIHIRNHTGDKPFKCKMCEYECSESSNLRTHIRTHTGEKSYKCKICEYKCAQSSNLKRHMRTHTLER